MFHRYRSTHALTGRTPRWRAARIPLAAAVAMVAALACVLAMMSSPAGRTARASSAPLSALTSAASAAARTAAAREKYELSRNPALPNLCAAAASGQQQVLSELQQVRSLPAAARGEYQMKASHSVELRELRAFSARHCQPTSPAAHAASGNHGVLMAYSYLIAVLASLAAEIAVALAVAAVMSSLGSPPFVTAKVAAFLGGIVNSLVFQYMSDGTLNWQSFGYAVADGLVQLLVVSGYEIAVDYIAEHGIADAFVAAKNSLLQFLGLVPEAAPAVEVVETGLVPVSEDIFFDATPDTFELDNAVPLPPNPTSLKTSGAAHATLASNQGKAAAAASSPPPNEPVKLGADLYSSGWTFNNESSIGPSSLSMDLVDSDGIGGSNTFRLYAPSSAGDYCLDSGSSAQGPGFSPCSGAASQEWSMIGDQLAQGNSCLTVSTSGTDTMSMTACQETNSDSAQNFAPSYQGVKL